MKESNTSPAFSRRGYPTVIPLTALAFAIIHLAFEYFTGGVKSHHILHNPDLPAISNWFGLITLPLLGGILGYRVSRHHDEKQLIGIPRSMLIPLMGALIYGALLATSFLYGGENITNALFMGLILCGLIFPVYRIEYILGFVVGMTITVGSVLPMIVGLTIGGVSFIVRFIVINVIGVMKKSGVIN